MWNVVNKSGYAKKQIDKIYPDIYDKYQVLTNQPNLKANIPVINNVFTNIGKALAKKETLYRN